MRKHVLLGLWLAILTWSACNPDLIWDANRSNGDPYFIKYFGGPNQDAGIDLVQQDEHFYVLGDYQLPNTQILTVLKTDLRGKLIDQFFFSPRDFADQAELYAGYPGIPDALAARAMERTPNGTLLVLAEAQWLAAGTDGGPKQDLFLIELSQEGQVLQRYQLVVGRADFSERARGLAIAATGDIYLCGYTDSLSQAKSEQGYDPLQDQWDALVVKLDRNLREQWRKVIGYGGGDYGQALAVRENGELDLLMSTSFPDGSNTSKLNPMVVQLDQAGGILQRELIAGGGNFSPGMDLILQGEELSVATLSFDGLARLYELDRDLAKRRVITLPDSFSLVGSELEKELFINRIPGGDYLVSGSFKGRATLVRVLGSNPDSGWSQVFGPPLEPNGLAEGFGKAGPLLYTPELDGVDAFTFVGTLYFRENDMISLIQVDEDGHVDP